MCSRELELKLAALLPLLSMHWCAQGEARFQPSDRRGGGPQGDGQAPPRGPHQRQEVRAPAKRGAKKKEEQIGTLGTFQRVLRIWQTG